MQSEVPGVRQLSMFGDVEQGKHLCLDCGVDISHRRRDAQCCEPCAKNRNRESANRFYRENRASVLERAKSRRQTPEYKQVTQEWKERNPEKILAKRQRQKQKHREKTGYNPEGRTCEDCGADISQRGHNAKKCVPCSTLPVRTCLVCHISISRRGARATFCGEQCKREYHRLRELEGYTKTCTKCNETKEHTEFSLSNHLRRPRCKSCEADATREYTHALPVEERQRRSRIQGQRSKEKRANLSVEEKTSSQTKVRQAHRRRLYGPDFDEDRLYAEQEGRCAICRISKSLEEFELDHDHVTGLPRGFLCKNCNFKLVPRYERFPSARQDWPYLNEYLKRGNPQ